MFLGFLVLPGLYYSTREPRDARAFLPVAAEGRGPHMHGYIICNPHGCPGTGGNRYRPCLRSSATDANGPRRCLPIPPGGQGSQRMPCTAESVSVQPCAARCIRSVHNGDTARDTQRVLGIHGNRIPVGSRGR